MPLKYYCPKCEKRYIDWGAEKLEFKCPDCDGEKLLRVGTTPDNEGDAPALSKSAAKRKAKPKVKAVAAEEEFTSDVPVSSSDDDSDNIDPDVDIDGDDDSDVTGDSLAIDDDD